MCRVYSRIWRLRKFGNDAMISYGHRYSITNLGRLLGHCSRLHFAIKNSADIYPRKEKVSLFPTTQALLTDFASQVLDSSNCPSKRSMMACYTRGLDVPT